MPRCVEESLILTGDDSFVVVLSPSYPSEPPCTYAAILSAAEIEELQGNPFRLSTEDGVLVAGAITSLWALAWGFRAVRKALD